MQTENADVTAAACRYLLVGLLPRLEQLHPGMLAEMRRGVEGDRAAMAANQSLSPPVDAVVAEGLRILELGGAK
jgi:hypothetical protein